MKKLLSIAILMMVFCLITSVAWSAPRKVTKVSEYLTAVDIEKISSLKGVKLIAKDPSIGAGGDLNFATSEKKMIVMIQVVAKSYYNSYKEMYYKAEVKALGDQAIECATIPKSASNMVVFAKGTQCIALTAFANPKDFSKNMLTVEQLIKLAKIIDSRI
ncbi:MAG TPA: hypothetical protein VHY08_20485 [Bacillota bacterium]|nr:hypothetical protein [Bacillota bacterium]